MNYLIQSLNESLIRYRSIFDSPRDVLEHIFFVNGNGVDFIGGNPVKTILFEYRRHIPWTKYFCEMISFDDMIEYYKECNIDREIEERVNQQKEWSSSFIEELNTDDTWDKIADEMYSKLNNVKSANMSDLNDESYWDNSLKQKPPELHLSDGYFKLQQVNEDTEPILFKVAVTMLKAYSRYFNKALKNSKLIDNELKRLLKNSNLINSELKRLLNISKHSRECYDGVDEILNCISEKHLIK